MFNELLMREEYLGFCCIHCTVIFTFSSAALLCKFYLFLFIERFTGRCFLEDFDWYFLKGFSALEFVWLEGKKMDGKRQVGSSSSSSFTAELFGIKESPASMSTGIFASMFPAPSVVIGRNSSSSKASEPWKKHPMENQTWNMNHRMQGKLASYPEGGTYNIANKERNSIYQEERAEPCHLSSSLYYGGQDIYFRSPSTQTSAAYPIFNKNEGEDDPIGNNSQGSSRGNWWQGSLYY